MVGAIIVQGEENALWDCIDVVLLLARRIDQESI
jgi:hypothetical protein